MRTSHVHNALVTQHIVQHTTRTSDNHTHHTQPHNHTQPHTSRDNYTHIQPSQTADLVNADASEEEKVRAMIKQSGEGFDPSQYAMG